MLHIVTRLQMWKLVNNSLKSTANCVITEKLVLQLYVRLDGLGDAIKRQLMQTRLFNITQLVALLQQLEVPTIPLAPVHVELLVKVQNKVVLVHHANQSTLNTFFEGECGPTI
jgi:hypothetical protein